jgi:hypothetical protein
MKDAHDADGETDQTTHYMRLPWPLVAVGLLALLALVLGIGLFANRYLRPQVGLVPTPETAVVAAPAATSTPRVAAAAPTLAPTLIIQAPGAATATPPPPTALAASTPAVVASLTPSALPTVEPALADEVGRAYVMFWRVRSQALLELDQTHLSDVMWGDYLTNVNQRIDELRAEGRAIKTQVVLNYSVVEASSDSASVVDYFKDNSIYVKIDTEEPLSTPTADQLNVLYRLRKFSDAWKVVDSARSK